MRTEKPFGHLLLSILALGLMLSLLGCATPQYKPQIQTFGGLVKVRAQDLSDCTRWARQETRADEAVPHGLLQGAFLGFALGAAASAERTATLIIGGLSGVNAAVSDLDMQMKTQMQKCLYARGYVVVQ